MPDTPNTPNILNVTLPLKQDFASQVRLQQLAQRFEKDLFPIAAKALLDSKMVHYARFVIIDNKYLQILTEYDSDFKDYTKWFAQNLKPFFSELFKFVEGGPSPEDVGNPDKLYDYVKSYDVPCLGGVAFSAYGNTKVTEIQQMIEKKKAEAK